MSHDPHASPEGVPASTQLGIPSVTPPQYFASQSVGPQYVALHPASPQPPLLPSQRVPWTLRLGGIAWIIAGVLFAGAPALAAYLTRLQAEVLLKKIDVLVASGSTPTVPELAELQEILGNVTQFSGEIWDSIAWIITPLMIGYVVFALISLALYIVLSMFTMRGAQWARVCATVLCAISIPAAAGLLIAVASLSWLHLNALWANNVGLALIVFEIIGLVLVWLPQSNAYVRQRRAVRRSA